MKKRIAIALSTALLCVALAGCGGNTNSTSNAVSSASGSVSSSASSTAQTSDGAYNLSDIVSAVEAVNPIETSRAVDDNFITLDMMLTADNIESYAGNVSNDQADSALIVAVKAVPGKADAVKSEMEAYKTSISTGGLYKEFADKEAAAKDARIVEKGDYVVMVIANTKGADYSAIDKALDEALK